MGLWLDYSSLRKERNFHTGSSGAEEPCDQMAKSNQIKSNQRSEKKEKKNENKKTNFKKLLCKK